MREVRPRGPYLLGGLCVGGAIAIEMARRLDAAGERVALVAVIDLVQVPARTRLEAVADALRRACIERERSAVLGLFDLLGVPAEGALRAAR